MRVVVLQPPFFRCVGSHNARVQLDLCYACRFLDDAGIDHVLVNADYGLGGPSYLPWRHLVHEEEGFARAADGRHPVLDETVEHVLGLKPDVALVAAGDTLIPTKDFGSPYIAAQLSAKLRAHKVRTVGMGPVYVKEPRPFAAWFDGIFPAAVNRSLVDFLLGEEAGCLKGQPVGALPCLDHVTPAGVTDYVMTAWGCPMSCDFCMFPVVGEGRVMFQLTELVLQDIEQRAEKVGRKMYLADAILPVNPRRLKVFADALEGQGYEFSCESRCDTVRPELLDQMWRMGVRTVKVGLEALDNQTLASLKKRQDTDVEIEALGLLHRYGFKVVGYLLLGDFYPGPEAMKDTVQRAWQLREQGLVDYFVVNVAAYQKIDWEHRYDSHFSLAGARRQGVPDEVMEMALALQEGQVNPTVEVVAGD